MNKIALTKGYSTIVDAEDYERLSIFKWFTLESSTSVVKYAARWIKGAKPRRLCRMHHIVIGVDPNFLWDKGLVIDHINRNGLDNRKENIRVVTRSINAFNSERSDNASGIYWDTIRGQYKVMQLRPVKFFIGWFHSFDAAVEAREFYK